MALTIASLICLLFVFLGGINKDDSTLRGLYFFKVCYFLPLAGEMTLLTLSTGEYNSPQTKCHKHCLRL